MTETRLSGLDASFLHLERQGTHMHVASTLIFEGITPGYIEFRDHLESRLHKVPRFRQKLRMIPFGQGRPVWVDDPHLNLNYHVRHTALPDPGGFDELRNLSARIVSQGLDRSKPLWEIWLVDRLKGGRFAVIGKSHHSLVDGVAGVDLTTVLFDPGKDTTSPAPPAWLPDPEPSDAELLARALTERATKPGEAMRGARALLRRPKAALKGAEAGMGAIAERLGFGESAPESPINREIGPYRRAWWTDLDLGQLKQVKNFLGGTVNDVLLGVVAGGLRLHLEQIGHPTSGLELKALVPLSVRRDGEIASSLDSVITPLPVWCADPRQRVRIISDSNADLKKRSGAISAEMLTDLSDFSPPTITSQAARVQARQSLFNVVVTNVPGPQAPIYLLGRRLDGAYPMPPLARNQGICVGAMSYCGRVHLSLISDFDSIPELDQLGANMRESLDELLDLIPKRSLIPAVRGRRASEPEPDEAPEAAAISD